ncbi:MAG TPA: hypothetical protein VNZ04_03645 [Trinickia sp.]|jgi:hypothetical protein|nr:hypothetical protein [Trinickia sp.]
MTVASIHAGTAVAMAVAVFAVWRCRRVPQVEIRRAPEPAGSAE